MWRGRRGAVGVLVAWLVMAAVVPAVAPKLTSVEDNRTVNSPPATAESLRAQQLLRAEFPDRRGTPALIVIARPGGRLTADDLAAIREITARLSGPQRPDHRSDEASFDSRLVSPDGSTATVVVPIRIDASDPGFADEVGSIRAEIARVDRPVGLRVALSGPAGIVADTVAVFGSANLTLLVSALVLVLVLLLMVYRSALLALIPLAAAGISVQLTDAAGALLVTGGVMSINSQSASIMSVLVIGLGTDYCLFIISRYREEVGDARRPALGERLVAMRSALSAVAESLAYSAVTVVLALLLLLLADLPALRGMGPFLALSVVVTVVVSATFVPAAVVLAGRAAFWPRRLRPRTDRPGIWPAVAQLVVHRPRRVVAGSLALLAVLAVGLLGYRENYDFVGGFRIDTESKIGQQLLSAAFPAGQLAPTEVVLDDVAATARIRSEVAQLPGVASLTEQTSPDGRFGRITVVYTDNPYSGAALDRTRQLRDRVHHLAGTEHSWIGGESATSLDLRNAIARDLRLIVPCTLLLVALILLVMARSILAAVYLMVTVVASLAAALGVTTFVLITLPSAEGFGLRVVPYIFVFLTALGVDYNIYLLSQLRREIAARGTREGLIAAMTRSGRVISSAGIILAATFAVLLSQPIDLLFQFGFAMAVGILLDTFLVRGLLMPAIVASLGRYAWWPSTLGHVRARPRASTGELVAEGPVS
jgi:RND superfamily putative drug exporter